MKFKYYLRGIGIGIIFASIIFLLAYRENVPTKMTNEEIIERAKQLGMIEANDPINKLIDKKSEADSNTTQEGKATEEMSDEVTTEMLTTESTTEKATEKTTTETTTEKTAEKTTTEATTEKTTEKTTTEATTEKTTEATTEKADKNEEVEITITKGSSSYPVCQKLQELGLIDDATKYDDYLIEHGYATRISVGTHKLKKGMDYHTIAELISDSTD